jgi:lysozyme
MAIDLIKSFESFRDKAYLDLAGIPTIGWGTTKGVKLGMTTTLEQAQAWLQRDVAEIENVITPLIRIPLSEGQFAALVSFVYNVGVYHFSTSTLLKRLNYGDLNGAAQEFLKWSHVNGHPVDGLFKRRKKEQEVFLVTINL